jgi:thiol-disulfide isomerase/thioredoxin
MRLLSAFLMLTAGLVFAEDVNRPAQELEMKMENGQILKLSQLKGSPVVLEFFSTTCPHCQKSAEEQRKDFPEFRKKYGATYPMGTVDNQAGYRFFSQSVMKPFYVPTFAFIDKNGILREQFVGGLLQNNPNGGPQAEWAELVKHIEPLLKTTAPAKPATAARPAAAPAKR